MKSTPPRAFRVFLMHGRYVTDILKMCMKKFNAEKIFFDKYRVLIRTLHGYTVSLACSQFLVYSDRLAGYLGWYAGGLVYSDG